jgi:hypothetical protein
MAGRSNISIRFVWSFVLALLLPVGQIRADETPPELAGASPGERSAIQSLCGSNRSALMRNMCYSNQMAGMLRLGRKPDLSGLTTTQRETIADACSSKTIPAERFACERAQLTSAGLPVRNEPGGGTLHMEPAVSGSPLSPSIPKGPQVAGLPFFSLEKWRAERPPMPAAHSGPALSPEALYNLISPSIYVVVASEHAMQIVQYAAYSQGSAVAITDRILLTNCHVVAGQPQISISKTGQTGRASLVYADPGGDRCFLRSEEMPVIPVKGVRRFDDLHVGESVFSIGTPVGLELSYGQGIVSGLRDFEGVRMVQNSAPTWHGSSGGGLFDAQGNLVGITTMISATIPNLNFSIAAEDFWP